VDARGLIGALQGLTAISNAEVRGPASPGQLRMQMGRGESPSPRGLNTENMFADLTGGLVFYNKSNAIEESIQTAVDDGELIYTLGFYPMREELNGTYHDLKVDVDRRGVSVRYRANYFALGRK
jgi:VWFA-related protein